MKKLPLILSGLALVGLCVLLVSQRSKAPQTSAEAEPAAEPNATTSQTAEPEIAEVAVVTPELATSLLTQEDLDRRGLGDLLQKERKPFITKVQPVEVDFEPILAAAAGERDSIEFDLGLESGPVMGHVDQVFSQSETNFVIRGHLGDDPLSSFRLAFVEDVAVGSFTGKDIGLKNLRYAGDGVSEIQTINKALMPGCKGSVTPPVAAAAGGQPVVAVPTVDETPQARGKEQVAASSSNGAVAPPMTASTTFRVLCAYTTEAREEAGSVNAMQGIINIEFSDTNSALAASNIDAQVELVHTVEVAYSGPKDGFGDYDSGVVLDRMVNASDGHMDNLPTLRNEYGADFVHLIIKGTDTGGLAYGPVASNTPAQNAIYAYGLTDTLATGDWTVAHELGHNWGCDHAVGDVSGSALQRSQGYTSYSFGWRWTNPSNGTQYKTLMAYDPGTNLGHYSNPSVNHLGVATGRVNLEDNARVITENKSWLENYRSTDPLGNLQSSATSVLVPSSGSYGIQYSDDVDFIQFTVFSAGVVTINSTGSTDTKADLLASNGTTLASNDDGGAGTNFRIVSSTLQPGVYYVRITGYDSNVSGSYGLELSGDVGEASGDYTDWASAYPAADLSNASADNDSDGVLNAVEWAWNTNPTSSASFPQIVHSEITNGQLTYTRRVVSKTGLTFSVQWSTDLSVWTTDTGAVQTVQSTSGDNETIQVAFSNSLLSNDKLFLRIIYQ